MAPADKTKYELLSDADSDQPPGLYAIPKTRPKQHLAILILQSATFLLAAIILTSQILSSASSPRATLPKGMNRINPTVAHQLQPCGTTAAEASAAGCIFDLLTLSWLAPECHDSDLNDEFLEVASEPFYYDKEARHRIPDYDTLSKRTEPSYTTRRYHIFHCSYGWRMMHRALERGATVESGLSSYHHTEHCTDALMNTSIPLEAVVTTVSIEFPDC